VDLVEIAPRQWMIPTFDHPELIARKLPAGMAVNHLEGPDGHRVAIRRFGGGAANSRRWSGSRGRLRRCAR